MPHDFTTHGQLSMLPTKRDVVARLFRQRRVFLLCFLAVIGLCALTGQYQKKYRAEMGILVRKERVDSVLTPAQNSTPMLQQLDPSEEELNSEVELLKSDDLLEKVVEQTGMATGHGVAEARAVRRLVKNLSVTAVPKSEIIDVEYTAESPEMAQKVLDVLGRLYLEKHQQLHSSTDEVSFMNAQVMQHEAALRAAEDRLRAFTGSTGVVNASLQQDLTVQQVEAMAGQQMATAADLADTRSRTAALESELAATPGRMPTVEKTADNQALHGQLRSQLLALEVKHAQMLAEYDPNYRGVKDLERQIAVVQQAIAAEATDPGRETTSDVNPVATQLKENLATAQAQLAGLSARERNLATSSAMLAHQADTLQAQGLQQGDLLRAVKTEQDEYQLYVEKREQSRMAASLDRNGILNVVIAQAPSAPALPVYSFAFLLLATLMTALILSLGAAFIADMFDPTVRSSAELEELLTTPLVEEFVRWPRTMKGVA